MFFTAHAHFELNMLIFLHLCNYVYTYIVEL